VVARSGERVSVYCLVSYGRLVISIATELIRDMTTQVHTAPLPFVTPYCWGYWWVREDGFTCAWVGWHVLDAKIGGPVNGNADT
jgi:hypothetical protein